jgi:glycosyltransferase AglE
MVLQTSKREQPSVSVIVSAYNAERTVEDLIKSLLKSDYPSDLLEIIIVDNMSEDNTRAIVGRYPVVLLEEKTARGPGAPRNKGIQAARGEIIAVTDADCRVKPGWIREGVRSLADHNADMVGGRVEFVFSPEKTVAEFCDAARAMDNERYIATMGGAVTANLFFKAHIFRKIGPFPAGLRAGEDMSWTMRASSGGAKLVYEPKAVIYHPARKLKALLQKSFRVGAGSLIVHRERKRSLFSAFGDVVTFVLPPRAVYIKDLVRKEKRGEREKRLIRLWWVVYLSNLAQVFGSVWFIARDAICRPDKERRDMNP